MSYLVFRNPSILLIFSLAAILVVCGCASTATTDTVLESSRVPIMRAGNVIGTKERIVRSIDGGREITTRQTMQVAAEDGRPRALIEEKTRTNDHDENTVVIQHRSSIGQHVTTTTATITGDIAVVRRESPGDTRETTLTLPSGTRFDNGAALLAQWDPSTTPRQEFYALDVRAPLIERIVYTFDEPPEPGSDRTLLRLSYVGDALRSLTRAHLDDSGALTHASQSMLGSPIETSAATTTDNHAVSNPVRDSLLKSPYRISRKSMNGHIRYTFGLEPGARFLPPQTSEQQVTALPGGFVLDICVSCGPGLDSNKEALAAALEPTFWLQADHPQLTWIANEVKESGASDDEKMARLERWARRRMSEIDFAGHYSAAEALARRSGDCTEGAVVLAALGRAAGIPTRVASGIVYSRERYHGVSHAFMPHAWTLAYVDGEWKSFDMSLEGFDATHIALTISDGDPGSIQAGHQLAALLRWDAMTEVKKRPE